MFEEAAGAAAAVARQAADPAYAVVADCLRSDPPRLVMTCARGSSDHAATYAKYLIETVLRIPVSSASPSVSSLYGARTASDRTLCLAISQSGGSPDLVATVAALREGGAAALALVNTAGSPLAVAAGHELALGAGPERSVAATKSYICSLSAVARLVALLRPDAALLSALETLPAALDEAWHADWSPLVDLLAGHRRLYVIGRGYGLGIAQEAALKFKETCQLHAEAYSAAEVLHGPSALIGPDMPLMVFRQQDETTAGVDALIDEARARGAPVLVAGAAPAGAIALPAAPLHPALQPIAQIQSFYRAVEALSRARGLDPDRPPHLRKVTQTL
jgi:glucosamine--fructose-6-phosphate aminotransferase (isomerizing)